jgi:hypothetical protein
LSEQEYSYLSPEIAKTLLQAGLWAVTDRLFPLEGAGLPQTNLQSFREALIQRAIREKMIPMLDSFSRAQALDLGEVPGQLSEVYRIISNSQYTYLRPILAELAERNIPVLLIKGADLDLAVYQQRFPRVMGDIDILVRPPDVPIVIDTLQKQGFMQGTLDKGLLRLVPLTDTERMDLEAGSIELAEYVKLISVPELMPSRKVIQDYLSYWRMAPLQDTFYLVVGYDVHTHLSLEFDLADSWANTRIINFSEAGTCLGQSFTDIAWYLAVRFYHELHLNSAFVMRGFLDVLAVVSRHGGSLDWERLTYIAEKYRISPALYYAFWHINEILPSSVPETVLSTLFPPAADASRGHDWGDFIPRMLGEAQVWPLLKKSP